MTASTAGKDTSSNSVHSKLTLACIRVVNPFVILLSRVQPVFPLLHSQPQEIPGAQEEALLQADKMTNHSGLTKYLYLYHLTIVFHQVDTVFQNNNKRLLLACYKTFFVAHTRIFSGTIRYILCHDLPKALVTHISTKPGLPGAAG